MTESESINRELEELFDSVWCFRCKNNKAIKDDILYHNTALPTIHLRCMACGINLTPQLTLSPQLNIAGLFNEKSRLKILLTALRLKCQEIASDQINNRMIESNLAALEKNFNERALEQALHDLRESQAQCFRLSNAYDDLCESHTEKNKKKTNVFKRFLIFFWPIKGE